MSTAETVCGTTVRNSASIDSLTASIQCASSTMNNPGSVRASEAALISAVNRRRRASGSICGSGISGSPIPSRSSSSSRSCGSESGICSRTVARAAASSRSITFIAARSSRVTAWNGTSRAWDSQNDQITCAPRAVASVAASRATRDLPIPGGPTTLTTAPWPPVARLTMLSRVAISRRLPMSLVWARSMSPCRGLTASSR